MHKTDDSDLLFLLKVKTLRISFWSFVISSILKLFVIGFSLMLQVGNGQYIYPTLSNDIDDPETKDINEKETS